MIREFQEAQNLRDEDRGTQSRSRISQTRPGRRTLLRARTIRCHALAVRDATVANNRQSPENHARLIRGKCVQNFPAAIVPRSGSRYARWKGRNFKISLLDSSPLRKFSRSGSIDASETQMLLRPACTATIKSPRTTTVPETKEDDYFPPLPSWRC